jgi:hypothetical protein
MECLCVISKPENLVDLERDAPAARFLGLRVRISPGHECLSLLIMCCQVEVSVMG